MADSSNIDAALLAVLAADATLSGLMPDGVWIDVAPPGSKQFVRISLDDERDEAVFVAGRAIEDASFLVEAVELSTVAASHVRAAAARIDALLEDHRLIVADYACMTVHREKRERITTDDAADPSLRWSRRGGHYRVQMSVNLVVD